MAGREAIGKNAQQEEGSIAVGFAYELKKGANHGSLKTC